MKFTYKGNQGIEIQFEETDKIEEQRVIEQGVALLRNIIQLHYAHKKEVE
ncbi:MAG: hypothetical protein ABIC57_04010 [bacterium]